MAGRSLGRLRRQRQKNARKDQRGGFDCIIVDTTVGDRSSLELHENIVQNYDHAPPMILLTAEGSIKSVLKAFRNGLSDYVSMDHDFGGELLQAIRQAVERGSRRMLIEEIEHLSKLANYDRLTGLANRNVLNDRLVSLIAGGERHGVPFSLFLIEINNFKQINDVHGHTTGDQAIRAFARKLTLTCRSSDTVGRLQGNEFMYLIDRGVSEEAVELACNRLASALSFSVQLDAVDLTLSASIGAAMFPADGRTADELMKAAGEAEARRQSQRRRILPCATDRPSTARR